MSYEKQSFEDRVIDADGKIVSEGTKLRASHLQHMEDGIATADDNATAALSTANSAKAMATSATNTASSGITQASRAYSIANTAQSTATIARNTAENALSTANSKQSVLVSGSNIKTVNGKSILGSGNIEIDGSGESLYEQAKKYISRFHHQYAINIDPPGEKEVDIILFSGQSNSCGRAQLSDCQYPEDLLLSTPIRKAFHFNNLESSKPMEIVEPISANGSSTYGYIPAFLNAYYETTGRRVCACFQSVGGANLNKFVPYVLDDNSQPTTTQNAYFKNMVDRVNHAKTQLSAQGYTVGGIYLVWCQGENDAYYYGTANNYATAYEETLTTPEAKTTYYKALFMTLVDGLKESIGLQKAFIIRIGHRKENPTKWEMYGPIVQAQNELGKEQEDCVLVSTIFAGAEKFIEEDGTVRNLMRDYTHYKPEGYVRAGLEAGVNAGIYVNSGKRIKPILLEYERLLFDDTTVYERPFDKFIYDPHRVDLVLMKRFAADIVTSISLSFTQTTLGVGDTAQIIATVYPTTVSNKNVLYVSSAPDIVAVSDSGLITAKAEGDATITVSSEATSSVNASIQVSVSAAVVPVDNIILNLSNASMLVGETLQLEAFIKPDNATDKTVTWSSSDAGAASVDKNGLVTALEQGDATITAVPNGNSNLSATCLISLAHNATATYLDLDFTQKTIQDYVDEGVLTVGDSTISSLSYDDNGLVCNDSDLTYGLKLVNPIDATKNWTVECTMTIAVYGDSGTTKTEAIYKNNAILSTIAEHEAHSNRCLAPCVLNNGYAGSVRLCEDNSTSVAFGALFVADGLEHTHKLVFDATTFEMNWYVDGVLKSTKTWSNGAAVSGKFGYVLGIHKEYSYSANYGCCKAGYKIRSLKVTG